MSKKKLVIVESPTKAKTISKFLDSSYMVESCMGHIRDLPESAKDIPEKYKKKPWKSLGVNVEEDFEPIYCIPKSKTKVISQLKSKMKQADELILATDEDREGESISWHLQEILKPKIPTRRIVFHEITKEAILNSLENSREVDMNLVQAQEARRVLDRLVGYTISPLLWKKISRGLSAGRVQSTAVRLISEREIERYHFVKANYYNLKALFKHKSLEFPAKLHSQNSKRIAEGKDFDNKGKLKTKNLIHLDQKTAQELVKKLKKIKEWKVNEVVKKPISRSPKPPFITSTLQQVANRQLGMSPKQAMSVAQKLYENGLITYMRTDSTTLSKEALTTIRKTITNLYGEKNLYPSVRVYKTKNKSAQEAHEAIRPAGKVFKEPQKTGLSGTELKLYTLIWQRTLACQMKNCEQEQTSIKISHDDITFSASGTVIVSPGYYKVYKDTQDSSESSQLPALKENDTISCNDIEMTDHQTSPPARYNEASLIQKLEQEGIGRPSTYAPIITTIQSRGYVKKINKSLAPTFTALAVTNFLSKYLPDYVDLGFTSKMEESLDHLALGKTNYVKYLNQIYGGKTGLKNQVDKQDKDLDTDKTKNLNFDKFKNINFHVGQYGAYISTTKNKKEIKASIPEDIFLSDVTEEDLNEIIKAKNNPESIGTDPKTKQKIYIKTGRYGPYLELEDKKTRASIPKTIPISELTLETASQLLELPKTLGKHPKTGEEIKKSIGRFGPYIVCDGDFRSVPFDKFFDVKLKDALEILAQEKKGGRRSQVVKEFKHNNGTIKVMKGKFSPYFSFKARNYSLSKDLDVNKVTLEQCVAVLEEKMPSKKTKAAATSKKKLSKKSSSKKKAAKK